MVAINFTKPAIAPVVRIELTSGPPKARHAGGRPKSANPKEVLNIRIDAAVLARFKSTGPGWQMRINDILAAAKL